MPTKVSSDTKVTLTIRQLMEITSRAAEKSVKRVITEMAENGAFDGSFTEKKKVGEQQQLLETFTLLQEQMALIADKIGAAGRAPQARRQPGRTNDPTDIVYNVDNSKKFDRAKTQAERAAAEMSKSMGTGPSVINESILGARPEFDSPEQEAMYQQRAAKVVEKAQAVDQNITNDDERATWEAMMSED